QKVVFTVVTRVARITDTAAALAAGSRWTVGITATGVVGDALAIALIVVSGTDARAGRVANLVQFAVGGLAASRIRNTSFVAHFAAARAHALEALAAGHADR